MNKFTITAIVAAVSLACGTAAIAANMTKEDYKDRKITVEADYKMAKAGCGSLKANAKDICMAEAKGKEHVALAELEAAYKPSQKAGYDVRVAMAEANFSVAKEKCDDLAGNKKDVCVKEARAAHVAAKADATAQLKTADANITANEKSVKARNTANAEIAVANKDAGADKRDADYAVAIEKCDSFAGGAKDNCVKDAKTRFGK